MIFDRQASTSILIKIFVRVVSDFHNCVQDLIATRLDGHLDLLLQFFYLIECVVELHLQVVALEDHSFEVHLLPPDHVLLQLAALLLNVRDVRDFLGVALLGLRHLSHSLLESLHSVIQVALSAVSHVLHHVQLLL